MRRDYFKEFFSFVQSELNDRLNKYRFVFKPTPAIGHEASAPYFNGDTWFEITFERPSILICTITATRSGKAYGMGLHSALALIGSGDYRLLEAIDPGTRQGLKNWIATVGTIVDAHMPKILKAIDRFSEPMMRADLEKYLLDCGVGQSHFDLTGNARQRDDVYVLDGDRELWRVYYTKGGQRSDEHFFPSEDDACRYLFQILTGRTWPTR